jgi:PhnB protein
MKLVPYLTFNGNAEEAIEFYKELLKGEITYIMRFGDVPEEMIPDESSKDKIMHASMIYNGDQLIYFSDVSEEKELIPGNVNIHFEAESEEEIDRVFEVLSKEATSIEMPLDVTFWEAKFGSLIDKYGIYWSMNFDLKIKQEH